ncbi:unnamed protein product [Cylicocyclus nassatus]|uniref:C-type lectin domain-containing protein n=1 Tax=Cylicocyclus nassatus TaxID=53992 RepID=A0AA36GGX8_CYLNA|nr:unnamed protein product [Cylicocyclus nassatus]
MRMCFILSFFVMVIAQDGEGLAPCPSDYKDGDNGQSCYKLYTNRSTYEDASKQCQRDGGRVVLIEDEQSNNFIMRMAKADLMIWIGLRCTQPYASACLWYGSLRAPYMYTNFFQGNPNDIDECVLMMIGAVANGEWVSADCDMKSSFICQVTRKKLCGDYSEYKKGRKCYKQMNQNFSLEEAEQHCQKDCGHLASIHNLEENWLFYQLMKGHSYARLGLKFDNDEFSWTDKTTFDYNNFARGACYNRTSVSKLSSPTMAPTTCDETLIFEQNGTIYSPGKFVRIRFPHLNIHPDSSINLYNTVIDTLPFYQVSFRTPPTMYFRSSTNVLKMVFVPPPNPENNWRNDFPSVWRAEFS